MKNIISKVSIKKINKYKMLANLENISIFYKKGIMSYQDLMIKHLVIKLYSGINKVAYSIRILERLLRLEPRCAVASKNNQEIFISVHGKILQYNIKTRNCQDSIYFRKGMNNPLTIASVNSIKEFHDCLAFGEYWGNKKKESVSVFARFVDKWENVYTFPAKSIKHIHAIVPASSLGGVLILTGDSDSESGIWLAKNNFNKVTPILCGSQQYRACVAFDTNNGILYATDTPLEQNYLYLLKEGVLEKLYKMPGPCINGTKWGDEFVFATSVEPDSSLPIWRYIITRKIGKGVKDRFVHIISGNLEKGFKEVLYLEKDILPMWFFQFGNVQFPLNVGNDKLIITPIGVKYFDGRTIILSNMEHNF